MIRRSVVVAGPLCAGKTSTCYALKKLTRLPHIPSDAVFFYFQIKCGLDHERALTLRESDAFAYVNYCEPYNIMAVEWMLAEFDGLLDFGATHLYFTDEARREKLFQLLRDYETIALYPGKDFDDGLRVMNHRVQSRLLKAGRSLESVLSWASLNETIATYYVSLAKDLKWLTARDGSPAEIAGWALENCKSLKI